MPGMSPAPLVQKAGTNVVAMMSRHAGCLTGLFVLAVTVGSSHFTYLLAQFLYIRTAYGPAVWTAGLRVVDKQGHLSDGTTLTGVGQLCVFFGTYLLTLPLLCLSAVAATYLGMRLRGERLNEQVALMRDDENESVP
jgi:hypothetical protein